MDHGANCYRRYLDGDDTGIVEIVKQYKDGLIWYLNGYVSDLHLAEDLTEDTFFKLMVKKPRYTDRYTFKTWLYTIARNLAIDALRRRSRYPTVSAEDCAALLREEDAFAQISVREDRQRLHAALRRLKPEYRQVLYLRYFEDFSNEQIAVILHKNRHQIETLIYRAKASLRTTLEKEDLPDENIG